MADIKQAAKWLKDDDKMVRRSSWPCTEYMLHLSGDGFVRDGYTDNGYEDNGNPLTELTPDDLLADDWEIADA